MNTIQSAKIEDILRAPNSAVSYYRKQFPGKNSKLARDSHGVMHACRVTAYIKVLHNICKHHKPSTYNTYLTELSNHLGLTPEEIIKLTQVAAAFHDSAREDEGKDEWDTESAKNAQKYLLDSGLLKGRCNEELIAEFFSKAAAFKDNYQEFKKYCNNKGMPDKSSDYIRKLIQSADCLDIIRCKKVYDFKCLSLHKDQVKDQANDKDLKKDLELLAEEIHSLLSRQSDLQHGFFFALPANSRRTKHRKKSHNKNSKINYEHAKCPYSAITRDMKNFRLLNLVNDTPYIILDEYTLNKNKFPYILSGLTGLYIIGCISFPMLKLSFYPVMCMFLTCFALYFLNANLQEKSINIANLFSGTKNRVMQVLKDGWQLLKGLATNLLPSSNNSFAKASRWLFQVMPSTLAYIGVQLLGIVVTPIATLASTLYDSIINPNPTLAPAKINDESMQSYNLPVKLWQKYCTSKTPEPEQSASCKPGSPSC